MKNGEELWFHPKHRDSMGNEREKGRLSYEVDGEFLSV